MDSPDFDVEVEQTAARVLGALLHGRRTAWEIKLELKVSHTLLHLALGKLLERGRVRLTPDKLTYVVEPAAPGTQAAIQTGESAPAVSA